MLVFDCETGSLDDKTLAALCPALEPPPHPGTFDPASVKCGNLGADKAKEKVDKAREEHKLSVEEHGHICTTLAEQHFANFKDKAALDATTGRVVAIGYQSADSGKVAISDGKGDEATLLAEFWGKYQKCRQQPGSPRKMVGCNIFGFDLPFLIRRSWMNGVDVPSTVVSNRRYFDQLFVDLREVWLLGQRWGDCGSSLDTMARALGVGEKRDGVNGVKGADFARLWCGTAEERAMAVAYLKNDLELTAGVAKRLGVV